ncbi:MAG: low molecular weight phosphotyrosine protein phosphatase [Natronohydrobacter sp.]|nr:low molecular weight phosphotyrosine protein phosphatase [Natronohydrobacter sp.]
MFDSILVVCVGNICRSAAGERLLAKALQQRGLSIKVSSAGIGALVGHPADDMASDVAAANGVSLDGHVARAFSSELARSHDLILVMEPGHKDAIRRNAPELSGRVMAFDLWTKGNGIPDPYRKSREFHEHVFDDLHSAAEAWAQYLADKSPGVQRHKDRPE